jgi:hypothetical protein
MKLEEIPVRCLFQQVQFYQDPKPFYHPLTLNPNNKNPKKKKRI